MLKFSFIYALIFICAFILELNYIESYFVMTTITFSTYFFIIIYASFNIKSNFYLKSICKLQNTQKVALTFDDGINPEFTHDVLNILKKHQIKATFFVVGKNIAGNEDILQRIHNEGHTIGNHTYSHSTAWGFMSPKKIMEEIEKTDYLIEKVIGKKVEYFRPPFGVTNPNITKVLRRTRHKVVGWSLRSLDTVKKEQKVIQKIEKRLKPSDIILLHDNSPKILKILPVILNIIKNKKIYTDTINDNNT